MEQVGAFPSGEWEPLTMLFSNEELEMAQRLLGQYPSGHQVIDAAVEGCTATQMPGMCEALFGSAFLTPNTGAFLDYSQESSYCSGNDISRGAFYAPVATPGTDNCGGEYYCYYDQMQVMNEVSVPMDAGDSFVPDFNSMLMDESVGLGENAGSDEVGKLDESQPPADDHQAVSVPEVKKLQLKRKSAAKTSELSTVDEDSNADGSVSENPKKKSRVSRDKSKKNPQPRRKQKARSDNSEGESNARQEGQSSSVCNSEDDTVSEELNGESTPSLNSDGKARASRGSATDPQSLYARKRRERINERLRILQNLVPNGTKVDISTMLEEAVHYVKFLQLQIKLLSSDELWMYAPIAYNGMDIGLNQILCPQL